MCEKFIACSNEFMKPKELLPILDKFQIKVISMVWHRIGDYDHEGYKVEGDEKDFERLYSYLFWKHHPSKTKLAIYSDHPALNEFKYARRYCNPWALPERYITDLKSGLIL